MKVHNKDLLFAKVKHDAIIPSKRDEDGWYDLYACFEDEYIEIKPHEVKLIPTGIASAFSKKWRMMLGERGTNTKSILMLMAGKIDSGYRGEIFVALYNGNDIPVRLTKQVKDVVKIKEYINVPYSKAIVQFQMDRVPNFKIKEISYDQLKSIPSERGIGKLGSSLK